MTRPAHRRREWLSSPRLQVHIILTFTLLLVVFASANLYVTIRATDLLHRDALALTEKNTVVADLNIAFHQRLRLLRLQLGALTFLGVVVVGGTAVLLSHTVAGPLRQLNTYLRERADGDAPAREIRFRRNDVLHELADSFNTFQRRLGLLPADGSSAPEKTEDDTE